MLLIDFSSAFTSKLILSSEPWLKQLLNSELTVFLTSQKDPMLLEKIMNALDSHKENEVDFNEFVVLVATLTVACNDFFQEQQKKKVN
eukprot:XP_013983798.1 PREDICTED: protein S100-Z-like [Salmo salar]